MSLARHCDARLVKTQDDRNWAEAKGKWPFILRSLDDIQSFLFPFRLQPSSKAKTVDEPCNSPYSSLGNRYNLNHAVRSISWIGSPTENKD